MKKAAPCTACGNMTTRFLFNDKWLAIPICSKKCEYEYFNTLTPSMKEQTNILRSIDDKIKKTTRYEKIGWLIAGFGLLIIAIGFLTTNVTIFLVGVFPLTCGVLSTSQFENKRNKLTSLRKRIGM